MRSPLVTTSETSANTENLETLINQRETPPEEEKKRRLHGRILSTKI